MAWALPVPNGALTSAYGPRVAPTEGASTFHRGIDIGARGSRSVRSIGNGVVRAVGKNPVRGTWVCVQIGGLFTTFQHLAKVSVAAGERVAPGQEVGTMGATGVASAVHLHFEVLTGWAPSGTGWLSTGLTVDPLPWLLIRGVNVSARTVSNVTEIGAIDAGPTTTIPSLTKVTSRHRRNSMYDFINSLYLDYFGSGGYSSAEVRSWVVSADENGSTLRAVEASFLGSKVDPRVIAHAYAALLGRSPSEADTAFWLSQGSIVEVWKKIGESPEAVARRKAS